ncbi:MAG: hypothetical protein ACTHOB_07450 [Ginsengibacter sp.]
MKSLLLICLCVFSFSSYSQRVIYPKNPYKQNFKNIRYYNVVGKTNNNFLVFIATKFENNLRIYDHSMRLIKRTEISFLPKETLSIIFFPYPKFTWILYVNQKRNTFYCMAAKINEDGELINTPLVLDSAHVNAFANNSSYKLANNGFYELVRDQNIYGFVRSEDESKILIFKQQLSSKGIHFSSMLYDNKMQLLNRNKKLYLDWRNEYFNNFSVTNNGDWIFTGAFFREGYTDANIEDAQLFIQKNNTDSFKIESIPLGKKFLDQLNLKIDNNNRRVLINSLYSSDNNIEGLFTGVWNEGKEKWETLKISELGVPIRTLANENKDKATSLNDFYINKIILKKDGGFVLVAEDRQSSYSAVEEINPYYYKAPEFWTQTGMVYNNILILNSDASGDLQWGNVITKKQKNGPGWLSFATILRAEKLDFFYNRAFKKTWLLENKSVTLDGKVIDNPLMRGLHDTYIFIPARGKQVSEDEFIIPYIHKNNLSFAKIEF